MSLINQVLKDIDQRSGNVDTTSPVDSNVKTIAGEMPLARGIRPSMTVGLVVLVAASGLAGWLLLGESRTDSADPVQPSMSAASPQSSSRQPPVSAVTVGEASREVVAVTPTPSLAATPPATTVNSGALGALANVVDDWAESAAGPEALATAATRRSSSTPDPMRRDRPDRPAVVSKVVTSRQASDNLFRGAEAAFASNKLSEGQRLLKQALERDENNHRARELLASVVIDLGRTDEAVKILARGVTLEPGRKAFVIPLALLKQSLGAEIEALSLLESSIGALDGDAETHAFLAALLQRNGRHVEAANNYVIALRRFPNNGQWLVGLGISLYAQGVRQAALEAFQTAITSGSLSPILEDYASRQIVALQQGN